MEANLKTDRTDNQMQSDNTQVFPSKSGLYATELNVASEQVDQSQNVHHKSRSTSNKQYIQMDEKFESDEYKKKKHSQESIEEIKVDKE